MSALTRLSTFFSGISYVNRRFYRSFHVLRGSCVDHLAGRERKRSRFGDHCVLPRGVRVRTPGAARSPGRVVMSSNTSLNPEESKGEDSASVKLVVIGDVHDQWGDEDEIALEYLQPDVVIFVGDIGNENVELIRRIAALSLRKVVVLGNHDAWYSLTSRGRQRAIKAALQSSSLKNFSDNTERIVEMLDCLGDDHIGYSVSSARDLGIVLAGGRPFSKGGMHWSAVEEFYRTYYDIHSLDDSTTRILDGFLDEATSDLCLVVVAHNGPAGLGGNQEDPCGIDFMEPADDFGDPDLDDALDIASSCGRIASLVLFGHMHHTLKKGGYRNMVAVDESRGTVYLNAAVVPRVKTVQKGEDIEVKCRHFLQVGLADGQVQDAANVWVSVSHASENPAVCEIAEEEVILKRAASDENKDVSVVSFYKAYTGTWDHKIVPSIKTADKNS